MKHPTKASDGPLIIPAAETGMGVDTFIAAPIAQIERTPQIGDELQYFPSSRAPQGPGGNLYVEDSSLAMKALVLHVHNHRLVDVQVKDHADDWRRIGFVPLVHDGDPDPDSPCGRAVWAKVEG